MEFKNWLEANWQEILPKDELKFNKAAVDGFVNQMADVSRNAQAVFALLTRQSFNSQPRYVGKIGNNFLTFDDPRLQNIKGDVTANVNASHFKFFHSGDKAGNIEIIHPPVVYDESDKHALYGVVVHELRHAQDWLNPAAKFKPVKYYEFDVDLYNGENLTEARAYAEELKQLFIKVGSAKKILATFSQNPSIRPIPGAAYLPSNVPQKYVKHSPFSLSPNLLKFAQELLFHFEKSGVNEVFFPSFAGQVMQTPAIQRSIEDERQKAATLVVKIIEKLLFRNFVIQS